MKNSTFLFVAGNTWPYRRDLKEIGGRWDREFQAWLIPMSHRAEIDELAKITDLEIGRFDSSTGKVTPLPSVITSRGRPFTYFPPCRHASLQSHIRGRHTS